MNHFKIKEVTRENENQYLDQIADLEKVVLEHMEQNGKIGQLFITGKDDIHEYICARRKYSYDRNK